MGLRLRMVMPQPTCVYELCVLLQAFRRKRRKHRKAATHGTTSPHGYTAGYGYPWDYVSAWLCRSQLAFMNCVFCCRYSVASVASIARQLPMGLRLRMVILQATATHGTTSPHGYAAANLRL